MVWWTNKAKFVRADGAANIDQDCWNCGNRTRHGLHFARSGVGFGNPLTGNLWVSTGKQWVLICPVCEEVDLIDKSVANELLGRS
jgi:hypothetical protein